MSNLQRQRLKEAYIERGMVDFYVAVYERHVEGLTRQYSNGVISKELYEQGLKNNDELLEHDALLEIICQ